MARKTVFVGDLSGKEMPRGVMVGVRGRVVVLSVVAAVVMLVVAAPVFGGRGPEITRIQVGLNPSIDPFGRRLAFESGLDLDPVDEDGDGIGDNDGGGLWIFDANGVHGQSANPFTRIRSAEGKSLLAHNSTLSAGSPGPFLGFAIAFVSRFNFALGEDPAGPRGGIYVQRVAFDGETTLISKSFSRAAERRPMAISHDGRWLAYQVWDPARRVNDLFIAATSGETPPLLVARNAFDPDLSRDGRFLVYVRGFKRAPDAVFVRDMETGKVERVSSDSAGKPGSGFGPSISASGRFVAFRSDDGDLVPGAVRWQHVFVKDRKTGRTTLVTTTPKGRVAKGTGRRDGTAVRSVGTDISDDGRFVAFKSNAPLHPSEGARSRTIDLFVKDRLGGAVTRIPLNASITDDTTFALSGDARSLVYEQFTPTGAGQSTSDVMLATLATVTTDVLGGVLFVTGSERDDRIEVRQETDTIAVLVDRVLTDRVAKAGIVRIVVFGRGGKDKLLSRDSLEDPDPSLLLPVTLRGGKHNDHLLGGRGVDELFGGDGKDRLAGGDGADILKGGPKDDRLEGQGGDDELFGGGGENDKLFGGPGDDFLDGGPGRRDEADGGPDVDTCLRAATVDSCEKS